MSVLCPESTISYSLPEWPIWIVMYIHCSVTQFLYLLRSCRALQNRLHLFSANDCLLSFEVSQRSRTPYESPWYVVKRVDRQVRLEVNPPLLISDDVKIEFFTKPKLDFVGLNSKMFRKSSKEFHFWDQNYKNFLAILAPL